MASGRRPVEPPRFSRWLVGLLSRTLAQPELREALLGDLDEDFRRRAEHDPRRARASYRGDAWRSLFALLRQPSVPRGNSHSGDFFMSRFFEDLRLAARNLRRTPGFSLIVILTLALGIGSVTAVYTLVDGVILRPLPFDDPDSLVMVWGTDRETGAGSFTASYPDFEDFRDRSSSFELVAAANRYPGNVAGVEERPTRMDVGHISHNLFDLLGTQVLIGRELEPADDRRGAEPVVVIAESLWRRQFGGQSEDASVLGRTLKVEGVTHTVVGVVRNPHFPRGAELFVPLEPQEGTEVRGLHNINVVGRLADGVPRTAAVADLERIAVQLGEEHGGENLTRGVRLQPLHEAFVGDRRQPFLLLLGASAFVLLIACANISNLLLHRAAGRGREVATRAALGASTSQLLRQFFAESLWLVGAGSGLGFVLAWVGKEVQLKRISAVLPRADEVALDGRVLAFGLAVTCAVAVGFALMPLIEAARRDLFHQLAAGARTQGGSSNRQLLRRLLVVVEVALAVVLVVGAGLMIRTMLRLSDVDPGFEAEHVLVVPMQFDVPFISEDWPQTLERYDALRERLAALPGVRGVAVAYQDPADPGWGSSFTIEGEPVPEEGHNPEAGFRPVGVDYFRTMGIPMLQGRAFETTDDANNAGAVVVNQAFIDRHLPDEPQPIGRIVNKGSWWLPELDQLRIVGVAGNVKYSGRHLSARPALYLPHRQFPVPEMKVLVRTAGEPLTIADSVRRAIWALEPELPIGNVTTIEEKLASTLEYRGFLAQLLSFFGATALFLCALGLYGVLAYATAQRTREIGLRVALGAQGADVISLVMSQGLKLTAVGLVAGMAGAWGLTRYLSSVLFGVERGDPTTLAAVVVTILAVSLLAAWVPTRRALQIEPTRALQDE
ncbi:MAG: ABC transporter permease [Acidobacteriota bacterium]